MDKQNSLKSKEKKVLKKGSIPKYLRKNNTMENLNNKKKKKLDLNLSAYYRYTKKNDKLQNKFSIKKNNISSTKKGNENSILFKKFLDFKNKNKSPRKSNIKNNEKDKKNKFFSIINERFEKPSISHNSYDLSKSNKLKNKTIEIKENQGKVDKNIKNIKIIQKKKTAKIINKIELFNNIININSQKEEINRKCNNFKRINSCQNFNNDKLKKDFELNKTKTIKKSEKKKKSNMTLNLISKKYFEKIRFNRYKYYNKKNNEYAKERRKRVEDKLNEIIYEKYRISRPLRISERIFYVDEEFKNEKNNNKNYYDNNNFQNLNINNNIINNLNFYLNDNIDNHNEQNNKKSNQIIYYNNQIDNIVKMRKKLSIDEFFGVFKRDYNLLDFNFTFLFHNKNINK